AGVWVDRRRRRPILIAADVGRAVLLLTIPLAAWRGWLHMGQLLVVAALTGILTVFFNVADQSFLPVLVSRAHLIEGNSKLEASGAWPRSPRRRWRARWCGRSRPPRRACSR